MSQPAGEYDLRVTIMPRVVGDQKASGEQPDTWPGPGRDYFAKRDALNAGETITQGIRQATGAMKLRIKGRAIAVQAEDRLRKKATGEWFHITGVARESDDTVVFCERVNPQPVGQ